MQTSQKNLPENGSATKRPLLTERSFRHSALQRGFIAGYAIAGIALVTVTMTGLAMMNRDIGVKKLIYTTSKTLQEQISSVHTAVSNCAVLYPSGNNASGFHRAYPSGTASNVLNLTCPGAPYANKNLWTGRDGGRAPLVPKAMGSWLYTNDATGIYLTISSNGDADMNKAIASVATKYVSTQIVVSGNVLKYWILKE